MSLEKKVRFDDFEPFEDDDFEPFEDDRITDLEWDEIRDDDLDENEFEKVGFEVIDIDLDLLLSEEDNDISYFEELEEMKEDDNKQL